MPFFSSCDLPPFPFSDHCGLRLSISVPDIVPPGPGLSKFNILMLEDDGCCQLIREFWADWRSRRSSFPTIMDWEELGKSKIKGITIVFCKYLVPKRRCLRGLLSNLAHTLVLARIRIPFPKLRGYRSGGPSTCPSPVG